MNKTLYVGNLPYGTSDNDLNNLFEPHGTVQSSQVIMDRLTGCSKRFGFVEMSSVEEAQAATVALNGKGVNERTLIVNEAQSREQIAAAIKTALGGLAIAQAIELIRLWQHSGVSQQQGVSYETVPVSCDSDGVGTGLLWDGQGKRTQSAST